MNFTPTSRSWLNLVERFFGELTIKRICCGVFRSMSELIQAIEDYIAHHNTGPTLFVWTVTVDTIMKKMTRAERFCIRQEQGETLH